MLESISSQSKIGKNNKFGENVLVGQDVSIGDNNFIGDNVIITGEVNIGSNNYIGAGCVIGGLSNHVIRGRLIEDDVDTRPRPIFIGNKNIFGEYVTVHSPVHDITKICNEINIGTRTHVAHDCLIEDKAIISIHCGLGGYVRVLKGANLGIGVNIHQRTVVGQYTMIGLGTNVIRHIAPGATVVGSPQYYIKPNVVGMKRNKVDCDSILEMREILEKRLVDKRKISPVNKYIFSRFVHAVVKEDKVRNVPIVPNLKFENF